jgi:hypothetical protein
MANYEILFNGSRIGNATVTDESTEIAPEAENRLYLFIRNMSTTATVWLAVGRDAEENKGIPLLPLEYYELGRTALTNGAINGICGSGLSATVSWLKGI